MDTLGKRIRFLRAKNDLSMDQLAKEIKVPSKDNPEILKPISSQTISNIENEKNSPTIETVIALASYFKVSTDWLLMGKMFQRHEDDGLIDVGDFVDVPEPPDEIDEETLQERDRVFKYIQQYFERQKLKDANLKENDKKE